MTDPYAELEVEPGAPQDEVKAAYRRLARTWHPDRNPAPDATERFRRIASAWEILGDPERRRRYDLRVGAVRRGELPEDFVGDVADAIERAERWILEGVLPTIALTWRGRGAEMAASFLERMADFQTPGAVPELDWWTRRRVRALQSEIVITAWLRPSMDATVLLRGQGFWEIGVSPSVLWEAGIRESAELDDAVMQLLLMRVAQIVASGRLPWPDISLEEARALDDAQVRADWSRRIVVGLVVGALGFMLIAGYNQW